MLKRIASRAPSPAMVVALIALCISLDKLADAAVTTPKLADVAVTTPKLGDSAVSAAKIGDGQVGSSELANGSVTGGKFAISVTRNVNPPNLAAEAGDNCTQVQAAVNGVTSALLSIQSGGLVGPPGRFRFARRGARRC